MNGNNYFKSGYRYNVYYVSMGVLTRGDMGDGSPRVVFFLNAVHIHILCSTSLQYTFDNHV